MGLEAQGKARESVTLCQAGKWEARGRGGGRAKEFDNTSRLWIKGSGQNQPKGVRLRRELTGTQELGDWVGTSEEEGLMLVLDHTSSQMGLAEKQRVQGQREEWDLDLQTTNQ